MKVDTVRTRFARLADSRLDRHRGACSPRMEATLGRRTGVGAGCRPPIRFRRVPPTCATSGRASRSRPNCRRASAVTRRCRDMRRHAPRLAACRENSRPASTLPTGAFRTATWRTSASKSSTGAVEAIAAAPPAPERPGVSETTARVASRRDGKPVLPRCRGLRRHAGPRRVTLRAGLIQEGPALIEQAGSTVVIGPGDHFGIDEAGNLRITLARTVRRRSRDEHNQQSGRNDESDRS